jgi:phosphomannomutase
VCGWEANGGFLTGSDIERDGRRLAALPTRDAFLPILCVLSTMAQSQRRMSEVFGALPRRFSRAALLRKFPRAASLKIVAALTESATHIPKFFTPANGFSAVARVDTIDGVRIYFANGDVAHVRPSGNADELRIYAVADSQVRADEITRLGVAEPDGILRQLERAFA